MENEEELEYFYNVVLCNYEENEAGEVFDGYDN